MAGLGWGSTFDLFGRMTMTHLPSEHFRETAARYRDLVLDCIQTSHKYAGIRSPTGAHFYASALFTVICSRAVAVLKLVPEIAEEDTCKASWDYGAIAVLARALLEARLSFYYLGIEAVSEDEWYCRWNLMCLHDCCSRQRLFEVIPSPDAASQVVGFQAQADELRQRLNSNAHFVSLAPGLRKKWLNGGDAYLCSLEEIGSRVGIEVGQFRMFYRMLSSQVHSLPLSFFRMDEGNRGRGVHSEFDESFVLLTLSFLCVLLAGSRDEMHRKFKNADGVS